MNGVYDCVLRCGVWTVSEDENGWSVIARKRIALTSPSMLHLIINSRKNKAAPSLVRSIFLLKDDRGKIVSDVCLLQYHLTDGSNKVEFDVNGHGNSRNRAKPFYPLKKSSLQAIGDSMTSKSSKEAYDTLRRNAGGICGAASAGDLPRGKKQLYNAKWRASQRFGDDVDDLLKYSRDKDDLVVHHSDVPEDLRVLGTSAMFRELERSTTSDILSYPFSVDPTFSLGKYEVTPVVFKNVLLKSKRTGESPIFLGPTMIHHNKSAAAYEMLASSCIRKCTNLVKAKGFVTDGESALQCAFEQHLKGTQSLRCFKHFENNCKEKLRDIGIKNAKDQQYFISKTFGVLGKEEGILDAKDGKDLRKRLKASRADLESKERRVLGKKCNYTPRYWLYLDNRKSMMRRNMVADVRSKAGMFDRDGKPPRCYTNTSESMNNVMKAAKNAFLKNTGSSSLTKLQFTRHVFEEIHIHQTEELQSAVAGVSDEYVLAEHAQYLRVPADVWFEWPVEMRKGYIAKIEKLTLEQMFQQKDVPWPSMVSSSVHEYRNLEVDVCDILHDRFGYSKENASAIKHEVLNLLNHPTAIQPKATLAPGTQPKFEVASHNAKSGCVLVTLYSNHAGCDCGRYRHDHICKHSIAVAAHQGKLEAHFYFLQNKSHKGSRTALAEHDVNKKTAGKKGARNKNSYRPERGSGKESSERGKAQPYSDVHHNNNPFVLVFLHKDAKTCKSCQVDFCHRTPIIPFNLVFEHNERWLYPVNGDWSKAVATRKETTRYYHTSNECILSRFPYFSWSYVEIPTATDSMLNDSHKQYIKSEFKDARF